MTFGNKIQSLREDHNMSQKELAGLVGVSIGSIAEWEADETAPSIAELSRLSKALGVSSDVLLEATTEADVVTSSTPPVQQEQAKDNHTAKHKKTGWIIVAIALLAALVVVGVVLWSQGIFPTKSFSENTARIEAADASVVTIFCYDFEGELAATGSGFVAFDSKTIITNYHVMTSAYTCKISTNQDVSYEVSSVYWYSKEQDIAILHIEKDTGLKPLTLGDSRTIKKGETVVAIGSPLGIKNTVSTGVLSGRLMESKMDVLQFTAPISSGSSGGALFDNDGKVIGITFASYVDGQNLNLAIPIELVTDLHDNTKYAPNGVSAICKEENPYIVILETYKNAPEVSIYDLKSNPQKYDNQFVKVTGYVSSCSDRIDFPDLFYIIDMRSASNGFDYDSNLYNHSDFEATRLVHCSTTVGYDGKLSDFNIKVGQKVVVWGKFFYEAKGSNALFKDRSYGFINWYYINS
jgi:S1-C subfamily serine protease